MVETVLEEALNSRYSPRVREVRRLRIRVRFSRKKCLPRLDSLLGVVLVAQEQLASGYLPRDSTGEPRWIDTPTARLVGWFAGVLGCLFGGIALVWMVVAAIGMTGVRDVPTAVVPANEADASRIATEAPAPAAVDTLTLDATSTPTQGASVGTPTQ